MFVLAYGKRQRATRECLCSHMAIVCKREKFAKRISQFFKSVQKINGNGKQGKERE